MKSLFVSFALVVFVAPVSAVQEFAGDTLVFDEFLVLPRVGRYGRVPIHVDPIAAKLAKGAWQSPKAGDEVAAHDGKKVSWSAVDLTSEGWLEHDSLRGGYAYAEVNSPQRQVVLLEASGHAMVFVNGEPRAGDPYLTGRTVVPVLLQKGTNEFLFHVAAGKLRAKLTKPKHDVYFDTRDLTLPDLVRGENDPVWLGVLLVNCRDEPLSNAQATVSVAENEGLTSKVDSVPPLGIRKVAVPLLPNWNDVIDSAKKTTVKLALNSGSGTIEKELEIEIVGKQQAQTRTFRSEIDGSVQSYRLLPATKGSNGKNGLLVTLHDSNETVLEHLANFSAAANVHVLAPTGRRVEGCDWEDWSARDVLEALDDAAKHIEFNKDRVWLCGTEAGGHGVLRLGGIAPNRWAALVPRSPWLEYPTEEISEVDTPIEEMLERIAWSNRLTPLLHNSMGAGILLEAAGTRENPATAEARAVVEALTAFQPSFEFRELDDQSPKSDLEQILQFCEKHVSEGNVNVEEVDCITYNPGEVATNHWLTILNQEEQGSLSRAAVRYGPKQNLFIGLTANVAALSLDVSHLETDTIVEVALDGEAVGEFAVEGTPLQFLHNEEGWHAIPALPPSFKQPARYGGVRSAFENRAVLVYGTGGSAEENAWALAKARYDAETILVRTNGSVDVVADTEFNADADPDRNVVLYGNADTNSVWPRLLSTSPVQVRREGVWIDRRPELGEDLACVFVRPRRRSATGLIGVVSGTGIAGMRTTDRLPYFVNGTNFPDLLLFSAASLTDSNADVRAAGYFGRVWAVDPGEIVWRDAAL